MKQTIKAVLSLFIAAAMAATTPAFAAHEGDSAPHKDEVGFYVAPEVGLVKLQDYCGSTALVRETNCEDSEFGFGLSGGYRFNGLFAVEGGFRLADGFKAEGVALQNAPNGIFTTDDTLSGDVDFSSWSLGLRGFFPVSKMFFATAAAGFHFWDQEVNLTVTGNNLGTDRYSGDDDGTDFYFGIGGEFAATDHIGIRASYTRYLGDDYDADVVSANLVWRF